MVGVICGCPAPSVTAKETCSWRWAGKRGEHTRKEKDNNQSLGTWVVAHSRVQCHAHDNPPPATLTLMAVAFCLFLLCTSSWHQHLAASVLPSSTRAPLGAGQCHPRAASASRSSICLDAAPSCCCSVQVMHYARDSPLVCSSLEIARHCAGNQLSWRRHLAK